MTDVLEQAIQQLLVPDSEVIKQATAQIKRLSKDPAIVQALCTLLATSQHAQVRQYTAVLLRKQILKRKQWESVAPELASDIRTNVLHVMCAEKDKLAQKSMTQVVAIIAKRDLPHDRWPGLLQFIESSAQNSDPAVREIGLSVLNAVTSESHEHLNKHIPAILRLCGTTLADPTSHMVVYYSLMSLMHLIPSAGSQSLKQWQAIVPKVVEAVKRLATVDQDLAADAMEVFDELIETEVPILQPYVQTFVQFCLEMAQHAGLESKVVCKLLSLIAAIVRQKKKLIVKLNLIAPILAVVFPIMCGGSACENGTEKHSEEDGCCGEDCMEESDTPEALASQVVDTMALHLPPEKQISALMKFVTPAFDSPSSATRRAAFIALAVSSEGCGEHLKTKYLEKTLLPRVYAGMTDPSAEVRNSAMFALGQFSEHLQPNISKHSSVLLPLLFDCLRKTMDNDGSLIRRKDVTRTYYAVEMFCENLGKEIVPYLDELVGFLLNAIDTSPLGEVKELAISAISSTAAAAKSALMPYFPRIQASLEKFLYPTDDEDRLKVQLQALEALGVLAQTLGEQFRPLATGCVTLGLGLMDKTDDPDLRRCIYSLFAAVSGILKHEMEPYLATIVPILIDRVRSVEGISARLKDEDKDILEIFEGEEEGEEDLTQRDDEDLERVEGIDIQTPFLDEKEDACLALGTIAKHTGRLFLGYMEESFKETFELLEYPVCDIRKVAATSAGNLCCAVGALSKEDGGLVAGLGEMLGKVVPQFIEMVRTDDEREVAMTVLDALNELLKGIGAPVLQHAGTGGAMVILTAVREVIQRKAKCQTGEDPDDLEDEEAEYDSMLIENAGDILPSLATIIGGELFAPYFAAIVPELTKKLRKSATVSERSFAIGVFAETLDKMGAATTGFVGRLYPIFTAAAADEDEEVRNNAVYGLGVLMGHGGAEAFGHYMAVLALLTKMMGVESDERVRDNVCGAVCRMILTNPSGVPIGDYFPGVADRMPLRTDMEENATVFRCAGALYGVRDGGVVAKLSGLVGAAGWVLGEGDVSEETKVVVRGFVEVVAKGDPGVVEAVAAGCEERIRECLKLACLQNGSL